jgi:hypothetical protein
MKRIIPFLVLLLIATAFAPAAFAQEAEKAPEAFLSINLAAGFPLDPFLVSVNGGGGVAASTFSEECKGFVNDAPTITVDWSGEADFVETFFYSDHDPVLLVELPDGSYLCNDDANPLLLDPVVEIDNPQNGRYNIWVGSYAPNQLIPGLLVITTKPEINVGTFSLEGLVAREPIPENLNRRPLRPLVSALALALEEADVSATDLEAGLETVVEALSSEGNLAAFELAVGELLCNGFVNEDPDYIFDWEGEGDILRIFFEGDRDATILVSGPDDALFCNDDYVAGENLNPLVDIPNPAPGRYSVFIGRLGTETPVAGDLTVVDSVESEPAILSPEQ